MKNFKTSILKELKRKGDIFAVLHLSTMLKSKRCMRNGAGLKLDTSILKHKFMNLKYPAFGIIKQHLFQIEVLKDITWYTKILLPLIHVFFSRSF